MQDEVSYILIKSKRKNVSLSINKLGQLEVKSPFFVSKKELDGFVLSKKDWILQTQNKIRLLALTPKAVSVQDLARQKLAARRLIAGRLDFFNRDGEFKFKKISIKDMSSRWGSCSLQGNLNFNYRLIYLPLELLDYVVVHELCHLKEHNHGKGFWLEVKKILPNYKAMEIKIKKHLLC